jgi:hypothetical protein
MNGSPEVITIIEDAYLVGGYDHGQVIKLKYPHKQWEYRAPRGKLAKTNGYKDTGRTIILDNRLLRVFVFYDNNSFERGEQP